MGRCAPASRWIDGPIGRVILLATLLHRTGGKTMRFIKYLIVAAGLLASLLASLPSFAATVVTTPSASAAPSGNAPPPPPTRPPRRPPSSC